LQRRQREQPGAWRQQRERHQREPGQQHDSEARQHEHHSRRLEAVQEDAEQQHLGRQEQPQALAAEQPQE
jgi:hypothetical protein